MTSNALRILLMAGSALAAGACNKAGTTGSKDQKLDQLIAMGGWILVLVAIQTKALPLLTTTLPGP